MRGIEQPRVYGYDPDSKKVYKKEPKDMSDNRSVDGIRYPKYKYNHLTGEVQKIKEQEPDKMSKDTKLRLAGALLATLAAGSAGYDGIKTVADYKPMDAEKQTVQANTIQPPQAPFRYHFEPAQPPLAKESKKEPAQEISKAPVRAALKEPAGSEAVDAAKKKIEKIFHREARSTDQMFDYHHEGKFNNAERMEKELEQYWLEWYKNHPDRLKGLLDGHYEYTAWEPLIEQRLKEKKIGDAATRSIIKYIALTETDFINKNKSKTNAVGPFQIMKATGVSDPCNLTINKIVDQRRDPLEAAEAAARLLQHDRERLGEKDRPIDLAKYAYNGSFVSHALTQAKAEGRQLNTAYFMHFMENDLNIIKKVAHESRWDSYRTKKNETLDDIFQRFHKAGKITNEAEFYCLNRSISRSKKLRGGIKIFLPLKTGISRPENIKEAFFNQQAGGRRENLDYGARERTIERIIMDSDALDRRKEPIKFREIMTTAEKGIAVNKIIKRYGPKPEEFDEVNQHIVGNFVPPNTKVRLPQA